MTGRSRKMRRREMLKMQWQLNIVIGSFIVLCLLFRGQRGGNRPRRYDTTTIKEAEKQIPIDDTIKHNSLPSSRHLVATK